MSEDLIKRSDAIEMLQEAIMAYPPVMKGCGETRDSTLEEAINLILDIPSADRPKGEWIDNGDKYFRCSLCGTKDTDKWHWCHGCGNPMKGADSNKNSNKNSNVNLTFEKKDEPQIYGNEYNCIMTMFGECSYAETGCGDCAVVEKVRKAVMQTEPQTEREGE